MAKKAASVRSRQNVLRTTLARLMERDDSPRRQRLTLNKWRLIHRLAPRPPTPDLVSLAICAIDRVGPAVVGACASVIEVMVSVRDEAIAAVLLAALAETARQRGTDRLIR